MRRLLSTILAVYIPLGALAQQGPENLCRTDEKVYFACLAKTGRTISICGSSDIGKDTSYLQYRYGRIGQPPELVYPPSPRPPRGLFEFSNAGLGAKASVRNLRFHIGQYTYVVFRYTAVHDPETAGVEVSRDNGKVSRIECRRNQYSETRGVPSVYPVNEEHFYEIQNGELSEISRDELVY